MPNTLLIRIPVRPHISTQPDGFVPPPSPQSYATTRLYQTTLNGQIGMTMRYMKGCSAIQISCSSTHLGWLFSYMLTTGTRDPLLSKYRGREEQLFRTLAAIAESKQVTLDEQGYLSFKLTEDIGMVISNYLALDNRYAVAPASLFYDGAAGVDRVCWVGGQHITDYHYPQQYKNEQSNQYNLCVFVLPESSSPKTQPQHIHQFQDEQQLRSTFALYSHNISSSMGKLRNLKVDFTLNRIEPYNPQFQQHIGSPVQLTWHSQTGSVYTAVIAIHLGDGHILPLTTRNLHHIYNCMSQLTVTAKLAVCQLVLRNTTYAHSFCTHPQSRQQVDRRVEVRLGLSAIQYKVVRQRQEYDRRKTDTKFHQFMHWRSLIIFEYSSLLEPSQSDIEAISQHISYHQAHNNSYILNYLCYMRAVLRSFNFYRIQSDQDLEKHSSRWDEAQLRCYSEEYREQLKLQRRPILLDLAEIIANHQENKVQMPDLLIADVYFRYAVEAAQTDELQTQQIHGLTQKMLHCAQQIYEEYGLRECHFGALVEEGKLRIEEDKGPRLDLAGELAEQLFSGRELAFFQAVLSIEMGQYHCLINTDYAQYFDCIRDTIRLITRHNLRSHYLKAMLQGMVSILLIRKKIPARFKEEHQAAMRQIASEVPPRTFLSDLPDKINQLIKKAVKLFEPSAVGKMLMQHLELDQSRQP